MNYSTYISAAEKLSTFGQKQKALALINHANDLERKNALSKRLSNHLNAKEPKDHLHVGVNVMVIQVLIMLVLMKENVIKILK